jgi:arylsulfatase A
MRLAALALALALGQAPGERPNVVIFLADDLGWGDLGCTGNPVIQTPHLDSFSRQSLRFLQGYSASAVCSPSRSAILTGRTPFRTGVYDWIPAGSPMHLRSSEVALPKLLRAAGYATCHAGKWHLNGKFNSPDQPQPNDHGYDWWMATQNNAAPSHKNPANFARNGKEVGPLEGFSSALVAAEAVEWLKTRRDKAKPFFLAVWTHEPHLPIESDPKHMAPYAGIADENVRQHHGNVTQLDHAFGTLMKALDEEGVAGRTAVFFTSDNGPEGDGLKGRARGSTGGLRGRKRAVYEGGIRVPFMVRWPGRVKPGTTEEPAIGSDLFVTALAIAGVEGPKDRAIDGASLLPAFEGKAVERKIPLYWRCPIAPGPMKAAMRQGDWKVVAAPDLSKVELYNLKADPKEESDLASREPDRLKAMTEALDRLQKELAAEAPVWPKK